MTFTTCSKKLLPGNSVLKVISWKNKPIFTEITLLLINKTHFQMIDVFDYMEFCLIIDLTMSGK